MATALYLVVYMTCSISTQLRRQEEAYRQANMELKQEDRIKDEYVFSLRDTIDSAVAGVKPKAEEKSITLNSNVEPPADKAFSNRFSIGEMITNLLLNAIKHTPANGGVQINAKGQNSLMLADVINTGIGIPENEIDKVFDEFFRASNARKVEHDGTGLGLSIVKQIV